jgi:hypothetical protein
VSPLRAAFLSADYLGQLFGKHKEKKKISVLEPLPSPSQKVAIVPARPLAEGTPILVVLNWWIELILRGIKTVEMRNQPAHDHVGKRIALCVSGAGSRKGGFLVLGTALLSWQRYRGALPSSAWADWVQRAGCVGGAWPVKYPWILGLTDVEAFAEPVFYSNPKGKKGEGMVWRTFGMSWVQSTSGGVCVG